MRLLHSFPFPLVFVLVLALASWPDKLQCATDKHKGSKTRASKGVSDTVQAVYDKLTHLLWSQKEERFPIVHDMALEGRELPFTPNVSPSLLDTVQETQIEPVKIETPKEAPVSVPVRDRYYPLVRREPLVQRRKAHAPYIVNGRIDPTAVPMLVHNPFPHIVRREPRIRRKEPAPSKLSPSLLTPESFLGEKSDQETPSLQELPLPKVPSRSLDTHSLTGMTSTGSPTHSIPQVNMVKDFLCSTMGPIGSGSYGVVHLVKHRRSNVNYAFKVFSVIKRTKGPHTRQGTHGGVFNLPQRNGYNEFYILRVLPSHPNIIQIAGVNYDRIKLDKLIAYNTPDILYEYMDHGSLENVIKKVLSPVAMNRKETSVRLLRIKTIMHGILSGLVYIHSRDIIHRDIKPSNILLSKAGNIKLADFGLALDLQKRGTEQTGLSPYVYTRMYRAPEILVYSCDSRGGLHRSGSDAYGKPADLWAVGIIMIELYMGTWPFPVSDLKDSFDMLYYIVHNLFFSRVEKPLTELQKQWQSSMNDEPHAFNLLAGLLMRNPKERMTAAEALTHPYFEDLQDTL